MYHFWIKFSSHAGPCRFSLELLMVQILRDPHRFRF